MIYIYIYIYIHVSDIEQSSSQAKPSKKQKKERERDKEKNKLPVIKMVTRFKGSKVQWLKKIETQRGLDNTKKGVGKKQRYFFFFNSVSVGDDGKRKKEKKRKNKKELTFTMSIPSTCKVRGGKNNGWTLHSLDYDTGY